MTKKPTPLLPLRRACAGLGLAAALLAAGCAGQQPDRYYSLSTPAASLPAVAPAVPPLYIDVAAVAVPERLARPQMLVRRQDSGPALRLLDQHRWASSFENELRDALSSGVAARLGAVDISRQSRHAGQPAWRIAVRLRQFDALENGNVSAAFTWTLRRSDAERSLDCGWSGMQPAPGGVDAVAEAAQRLTAEAAAAIARQVAALRADPAAACLP